MRHRTKHRVALQVDCLETRYAPSGGLLASAHAEAENHHRHARKHHHAHVQKHHAAGTGAGDTQNQKGLDDGANHDKGDDNLPKNSGQDDGANHDKGDDNLPKNSGQDDGANHDKGDDNNGNRHGGR